MGQLVEEPLEDPREAAGLEVLDECAREEARLFARRARQLVETARLSRELEALDGRPRFAVLDRAASLRVGQQSAQGQLAHAERLVADFPLLYAQLAAGAVLVPQGRRVLEHSWGVSVEVAQEVDRRRSVLVWADPAGWVGARLTRAHHADGAPGGGRPRAGGGAAPARAGPSRAQGRRQAGAGRHGQPLGPAAGADADGVRPRPRCARRPAGGG